MKAMIFLVVALVVVLSIPTVHADDYEKTYIGKGSMPMFVGSDTIAYVNDQGNLVLADIYGNTLLSLGNVDGVFWVEWLGDHFVCLTQEVTYENNMRQARRKIFTIDLEGQKEVIEEGCPKDLTVPIRLPDGTVGYQKKESGSTYFNVIKKGSLEGDAVMSQSIPSIAITAGTSGRILRKKLDGSAVDTLTKTADYVFPRIFPDGSQLSPDGNKLLAIKVSDGRPVVIDITTKKETTLGDSIVVLEKNVQVDSITYTAITGGTVGYLSRWSPSGKVVTIYQRACMGYVGDREIEEICASDIQVFNPDGIMEAFIKTDDLIEIDAWMSADGTILTMTEDGKVYLLRKEVQK